MNARKYFYSIALLLAVTAGCKKESYTDTSFVNGITSPAKLSVLFDITQDNSGLVTITPNGEGAVSYDVYYGDAGSTYVKVQSGKNVQHTYAEGNYTVKIVGHGLNGKTTEFTQPLTVSFRAPENLKTTVTTSGLSINVSASATYETLFKVYYGDSTAVNPEPFKSFLEGQTLTHTYAGAGVYVVRVVALSGGAATTTLLDTIKVGKQIDLPVTFDDPNYDYTMSDFGGNQSSVAADPANPANKVLKAIKTAGAEVWAGTTIGTSLGFATKIPVTAASSKMSVRVYSPAAGLDIKLKIEDHNNGNHAVETDVKTTVANKWETLTFDFNSPAAGTPGLNAAYTYDKASLFFNFGVNGDGKAYYADDLKFVPSAPALTQINLPVTFDDATVNYTMTDFGNNQTTDAIDPTNAANKVKLTTKPNGAEVWAGVTIGTPAGFLAKVPLTATSNKMTVRVYSPAAGIDIKLKLEDHTNGANSVETDVLSTVANGWETLTFDFTKNASGTPAVNYATTYDKASIFFDFGNAGNGKKFYWDDVKMAASGPEVLGIPLTFESATLSYAFTNFNGGTVTVIANPKSSGINTSAKVGKMVKNPGETYGGSYITLPNPIDFSTKKTFTMKVYSPRVGAKVLLKVENLTDGGTSFEKEVTTTKANEWETLTFDYSTINTAKSYQKVVLIFDNGTSGDGSANYTWLFDDISLN
ncbi:phage tail protein [Mucilaginibacter ginsenosidivorax]|uniref:PKD domain-containing protein n=1 Tax=Mucilaginibacter ginsenosidivorax TaxID=862126 RepID=A0A5B8WAM9_9SPHI|nr:hypothetical protein [Mucilaginibacter ginsenosidivorax]QEC79996.1 hypothetical protein FSB76_30060 [Mucilaginibacter ginsenosidivorax]